jgi:hypothetical protein
MCGIDGGHSGIVVNRTGNMAGFERIGVTVGVAGRASANILAQARLVDAGYGSRYDGACDLYEVDTDSGQITFTRRVMREGKLSPHYSHLIERAYVETVTGNKARYTRRKGAAAEAGKDLLSKFAHGSDRSSGKRHPKSADSRSRHEESENNMEANRGVDEGKDQPAKAPHSNTGVRVTQVQQTLSVDILFVYRMLILLGLLTPLALVQVYDLADDRGACSVGPRITKFISAATGRGFDVKFIRTDGEGAIAALTTVELEDEYGLLVEPTGSGTHVAGRSGADVPNAEEESPMPFPRPTC